MEGKCGFGAPLRLDGRVLKEGGGNQAVAAAVFPAGRSRANAEGGEGEDDADTRARRVSE
jgi:hypothetical protein